MAHRIRARLGARRVRVSLALFAFVALVPCGASSQTIAPPYPLPEGWDARDVGKVLVPGLAISVGQSVAIAASGVDIYRYSDEFHFYFARAAGDVTITARLAGVENRRLRAGLMIRESLRPDAAHGYIYLARGRIDFRSRRRTGAGTRQTADIETPAPVWLKLERRGSTISAYSSPDGTHWRFTGSELIDLPDSFYVGLAVTSRRPERLAIAAFDTVTVTGTSTGSGELPGSGDGGSEPEPVPEPVPGETGDPTQDPANPTTLVFEPSPDHQWNVDAYVFEVAPAAGGSALIRSNIGKPSVVDGECTVDIRRLLADLPPGRYVGRLKAVNANGSSPLAVSPVFEM